MSLGIAIGVAAGILVGMFALLFILAAVEERMMASLVVDPVEEQVDAVELEPLPQAA